MGTNFYWVQRDENGKVILQYNELPNGEWDYNNPNYDKYDIQIHLGKRSSAGAYCYDCGSTLNRQGTQRVHHGADEYVRRQFAHLRGVERMIAENNATHFDECPGCGTPRDELKSVCSFSWTLMKHRKRLEELAQAGMPSPVNSLAPALSNSVIGRPSESKMKAHNEQNPIMRELFGPDKEAPGVFINEDGNIGPEYVVVDEYCRYYTAAEFVAMTDEYKMWFQSPYKFS